MAVHELNDGRLGDAGDVPLLEVLDLRTTFRAAGGRRRAQPTYAVDGVSLSIPRGRTLGLVGESGCGKTSLSRTILRLTPADAGRVLYDGRDLLALAPRELHRVRRDLQMVFQDAHGSLNPRMTVADLIAEPLRIHRVGPRREITAKTLALLDRVGLHAGLAARYPHELSGGQRQRVGIARAIALQPRLIIWDEPVSALDVSIQAQILQLISELQADLGLTYLFIAHHLAVVRTVSDAVAVMYLGRIAERGPTGAIFDHPRHPYTQALIAAVLEPDHLPRPNPPPAVPGEPSAIRPIRGCLYAPRCPLVTEKCREVTPALRIIPGMVDGHEVACHHAERTAAPPIVTLRAPS